MPFKLSSAGVHRLNRSALGHVAISMALAIALFAFPVAAQQSSAERQIVSLTQKLNGAGVSSNERVALLTLRADAYSNAGQPAAAMRDWDEVERLSPTFAPVARLQKAMILNRSFGKTAEALQMLDEAKRKWPNAPLLASAHGELLIAAGRYPDAIETLKSIPNAQGELANRINRLLAQAYFNNGNYAEAVELYDRLLAGADPITDKYLLIWRFAAETMAGKNAAGRLKADKRSADNRTSWPGPIISFFLGSMSAKQLLTEADDPLAQTRGSVCEAPFYIGVVAERAGKLAEARTNYQQTLDKCHAGMMENWAAQAGLRRLGNR